LCITRPLAAKLQQQKQQQQHTKHKVLLGMLFTLIYIIWSVFIDEQQESLFT